jgi:hypothetical protein
MSNQKTTAWYADRYANKFGMHLIPLQNKSKLPVQNDWGNNTLSGPGEAAAYFEQHPLHNVGVALGPSRLCSLDIDCMDSFRTICENFGIDLGELIRNTPTIQGAAKGMRLMFRVPVGVELPYAKLNWKRDDETAKSYTVFELRAASGDKQRFDCLPPSIHPDTLKPYVWITQPMQDWPEPPRWMHAMWTDFDKFKGQMQAMCPWLPTPEPAAKPAARSTATAGNHSGTSVIDAYSAAHGLEAELSRYGYKQIGSRWLSPHSGTGLPGVLIFPDGASCWIHHASDPLCSEDSGKPVNSFDLFCHYDHNGDTSKAVKHAAEILGIKPEPRQRIVETPPSTITQQPAGQIQAAPSGVTPTYCRGTYDLETSLPFANEKGTPVKHIDNLAEICRRIGVTIRYNMIAKEEEILIPGQSFSIDNMGNATLAWLRSECSLFRFPVDSIDGMVTYIADRNQYNPVAEWVGSKPWDGVPRVQAFYDTVVGAFDHVERKRLFKETLLRRWMISAIAAAFSPNGISAAGVLTFQGAQYLGKTKWFKQLVPAELGVLKDGMILRPDDKDSVKQCVSFWLVELGELDATFRKADIAALKSFLTNDSDVLRRAYARKESKFARRTVFFASVNPKEFLHDPTGNRRYWTIEAKTLDHSHDLDMQQVWAEFYALWKSGEGYYLTNDEVGELNEHNESFTAVDPIEDRILTRLAWDMEPVDWRWSTSTDILMDIGFDRPTRADATSCAAFIRKHNGNQGKRSNGKTLLYAPKRVSQTY